MRFGDARFDRVRGGVSISASAVPLASAVPPVAASEPSRRSRLRFRREARRRLAPGALAGALRGVRGGGARLTARRGARTPFARMRSAHAREAAFDGFDSRDSVDSIHACASIQIE